MIGKKLAHYEILEKLGEGGMGEVYRARDTKLERDVALKVLPSLFAQDRERLSRFRREAKLLASLQHQNIGSIFGLEESNGQLFLALEIVEGADLSDPSTLGALPPSEALEVARQIAEGLEFAHDKGIVHRDLKPANIKLSTEGRVKILDFGLAKAYEGDSAASEVDLSRSPTITENMTHAGVILGTAGYMSPEQARGRRVDHRTDIWAFGCVLYELLTGRQAFEGETISDTMASILKDDPDWDALPAEIPVSIPKLLRRCLQKDPRSRYQHIGDIRYDIEEALAGRSSPAVEVPSPQPLPRRKGGWIWKLATFGFAISTLVLALVLGSRSSPDNRPFHASVLPPEGWALNDVGGAAGPAKISPDGQSIVFVATSQNGISQLWIHDMETGESRDLGGTEGARRPFWSPDSRYIGFFAEGKLRKVSATGGPVLSLANALDGRGGTWNEEGTILYSADYLGPISRVDAAGGTSNPVTTNDLTRRGTHRYPHFLPDGNHFLFLDRKASAGQGIEPTISVSSLDSDEVKVLVETASNPFYSDGHLLYVRQSTLMARPFDPSTLEFTGEEVPLVEEILFDRRFSRGVFSVSQNGVLCYRTGQGQQSQLIFFDREGNIVQRVGEPSTYLSPAISPDESRVAVVIQDETTGIGDIWMLDFEREIRTRFTFGDEDMGEPIWYPDGSHLIFRALDENSRGLICRKSASGAGGVEILSELPRFVGPQSLSPNAEFLTYEMEGEETSSDIWILPLDDPSKARPYLATEFTEFDGDISPDGRWVAYSSNESGSYQVYVSSFPDPGGKWQVSTGGGHTPRWSHDGAELFYLSQEGVLMSVEIVAEGPSISLGAASVLFRTSSQTVGGWRYDITRDGERFLVNTSTGFEKSSPIRVVINWTAMLED